MLVGSAMRFRTDADRRGSMRVLADRSFTLAPCALTPPNRIRGEGKVSVLNVHPEPRCTNITRVHHNRFCPRAAEATFSPECRRVARAHRPGQSPRSVPIRLQRYIPDVPESTRIHSNVPQTVRSCQRRRKIEPAGRCPDLPRNSRRSSNRPLAHIIRDDALAPRARYVDIRDERASAEAGRGLPRRSDFARMVRAAALSATHRVLNGGAQPLQAAVRTQCPQITAFRGEHHRSRGTG